MRKLFCAAALTLCLAGQAMAAFNLQISEIWPGNTGSDNLTDDWFEVTNLGDMPWTSADGTLYFDDSPSVAANATPLIGVASIAPGESVIFVDEEDGTGLNLFLWHSVWDGPITAAGRSIPQVGSYQGAGLGQGGDGVSLFLDSAPPVALADLIDFQTYPNANNSGGKSYDGVVLAFTTVNFPGVVTTDTVSGEPAIGTPGYIVPEPTSLLLLGMAVCVAGAIRK